MLCILVSENNRLSRKEKTLFYITYAIVALASLMEWLGMQFNGDMSIPVWLFRLVKCADYILTPAAGAALIINLKTDSIWGKIVIGILGVNLLFQVVSGIPGRFDFLPRIGARSQHQHGQEQAVALCDHHFGADLHHASGINGQRVPHGLYRTDVGNDNDVHLHHGVLAAFVG